MPTRNYVELDTGIPERLHFRDHIETTRTITDPLTLLPATRNVLVFEVDEENGQKIDTRFSVMADKLYKQFKPYLAGNAYRGYDFVITKTGEGFGTSWSVQVIPRK